MRFNLRLTRPGLYLLIASVVVGLAFMLAMEIWVRLPPEWAWLDWEGKRRRMTLWDLFVIALSIVVGVVFFWIVAAVLRRFWIEVHGGDPSTRRRRRRRKWEQVEESWEIRRGPPERT